MKERQVKSNYYSVKEASEYMNISESTLRSYLQRGIAPSCYRINRKIIFSEADMLAWLATKRSA